MTSAPCTDRTYEELVSQVKQLEATVRTLMGVITKGSEERDELAMALANAMAEKPLPSLEGGNNNAIGASADSPPRYITNNDSSSNNNGQDAGTVGITDETTTSNVNTTAGNNSNSHPYTTTNTSNNGILVGNRSHSAEDPNINNNNNYNARSGSRSGSNQHAFFVQNLSTDDSAAQSGLLPTQEGGMEYNNNSSPNNNQNRMMGASATTTTTGYSRSPTREAATAAAAGSPNRQYSYGYNNNNNNGIVASNNASPNYRANNGASSPTKSRFMMKYAHYDRLDPTVRNYLLTLEIENRALKREVDVFTKEQKRRESDIEHMKIVLMKRVALAEEAAQTYATQAAGFEAELMAWKVKHQEVSLQLSRALGAEKNAPPAQYTRSVSMGQSGMLMAPPEEYQ